MTEERQEQLKAWLEQHSDKEYIKFEKIKKVDRLHPSQVLCGYLKVASLMKKPEKFELHSEHDICYLPSLDELNDLTEEDAIYLLRCGIGYDDECDCLSDFT